MLCFVFGMHFFIMFVVLLRCSINNTLFYLIHDIIEMMEIGVWKGENVALCGLYIKHRIAGYLKATGHKPLHPSILFLIIETLKWINNGIPNYKDTSRLI